MGTRGGAAPGYPPVEAACGWAAVGEGGHGKGRVVSHAMLCSLALATRLMTSDRVGHMVGRYVQQGRGPRGVRFSADMQLPAPLPPPPPPGCPCRLCSSRPYVLGMLSRVTASVCNLAAIAYPPHGGSVCAMGHGIGRVLPRLKRCSHFRILPYDLRDSAATALIVCKKVQKSCKYDCLALFPRCSLSASGNLRARCTH